VVKLVDEAAFGEAELEEDSLVPRFTDIGALATGELALRTSSSISAASMSST
jgi:hypothetical protein